MEVFPIGGVTKYTRSKKIHPFGGGHKPCLAPKSLVGHLLVWAYEIRFGRGVHMSVPTVHNIHWSFLCIPCQMAQTMWPKASNGPRSDPRKRK